MSLFLITSVIRLVVRGLSFLPSSHFLSCERKTYFVLLNKCFSSTNKRYHKNVVVIFEEGSLQISTPHFGTDRRHPGERTRRRDGGGREWKKKEKTRITVSSVCLHDVSLLGEQER